MINQDIENFSFEIFEGDLTNQKVDAIVNAANTELILGGGVAGAIRRRGGPSIQEECKKLAPINTGDAVITSAGQLFSKYVVHTAGPIYNDYPPEKSEELLKKSVLSSLKFLEREDINSISFPAISAGIYGFPPDKCAEIMISTILEFIKQKIDDKFKPNIKIKISICLFGLDMYELFKNKYEKIKTIYK